MKPSRERTTEAGGPDARSSAVVRTARASDAGAIAAIYAHYVLRTTVSFEESAPDAAEMAQRIEAVRADELPWLVLEDERKLVGYAYATKWKTRSAYRHSVETSQRVASVESDAQIGTLHTFPHWQFFGWH